MRILSNPSPTKLVKLKSEVRQNPTNFLYNSKLIINLPSLLQQFCCKLNCFDLAYLLVFAQSAVPRPSLTTFLQYFHVLKFSNLFIYDSCIFYIITFRFGVYLFSIILHNYYANILQHNK